MMMFRALTLFMFSLLCLSAFADHVTLSAQWDGSEDLISPFTGTCNGAGDLAYRQFDGIQVSTSDDYHLSDASDNLAGDLMLAVYNDSFDSSDLAKNLVVTIDDGGTVGLQSGQDYVVVVQHWCENSFPATFAVSLSGPGEITGAGVVVSPDWTRGDLAGSDPKAVFSGVSQHYDVSEPVTFPVTGLFRFAEVSLFDRLDMQLRVYAGSFNPADTGAGLLSRLDDAGGVLLEAGKKYLFVVTAHTPGNRGEWHWVMFPPGPLQFNAGLNGAWFNPATSGQGILVDVFTERRQFFVAWFTFDLERPNVNANPMIGDDGHRWLTAFGQYADGDSAISLEIENTRSGVFDSADPPVVQDAGYGSIELEFSDCLNGTLTYDIPTGPVSGVIPITRIANDHLGLCARLGSPEPGVITE